MEFKKIHKLIEKPWKFPEIINKFLKFLKREK